MLRKISGWIERMSKGWVALSALVLFVAFTTLVLPRQSASAKDISTGAGSPDMSFIYSPADLYTMAEAYGQQGREAYIHARFTFDLVWPIVYFLFLATAISWLFQKALPEKSSWKLLNLMPVAGIFFDYLENISTSIVMFRYPLSTPGIDLLAPVFTLLKWVFIGASFLVMLGSLGMYIWHWKKNKGR